MDNKPSFASLALEGVERIRKKDHEPRGRVSALPLLLRGAYYSGEGKWRACAEEDLRALWRGGVHDHVGGGFFSASTDGEWLRPSFEKRLDDNAILALLYTEAWEKGRMAFHREAAESTLDYCLRELADPSGLYRAGQYAAPGEGEGNPFLFTPAQLAEILGADDGRHFGECYDITDENNCGEGSIPNLILNQRWSLIPEGYDNLRERVRLAREARGGVLTDERSPLAANALLLAALARAARVFSDRRYLAAAGELSARLPGAEPLSQLARAALLFVLTELYAADYDPAHIAAAHSLAEGLDAAERGSGVPSAESDRTLSLAALGFDALWRLTQEETWRYRCLALLRELAEHPERRGPESLAALSVPFAFGAEWRTLLCVTPEEKVPAALDALTARYAPDLRVLLKTPGNAAALAAAAEWTAAFAIGEKTLFFSQIGGKWGPPTAL